MSSPERQNWYFTFGFGQPWARRFFVVENATYNEAREKMRFAFGTRWGFQYSEEEWVDEEGRSQEERYGLKRLA